VRLRRDYYDDMPTEQDLWEQEQAEMAAAEAEQLATEQQQLADDREHRLARGQLIGRVVRTHLHAGLPLAYANADAAAAAREFDAQAGRATTPLDLRNLGS
jgi:hypothetical protein